MYILTLVLSNQEIIFAYGGVSAHISMARYTCSTETCDSSNGDEYRWHKKRLTWLTVLAPKAGAFLSGSAFGPRLNNPERRPSTLDRPLIHDGAARVFQGRLRAVFPYPSKLSPFFRPRRLICFCFLQPSPPAAASLACHFCSRGMPRTPVQNNLRELHTVVDWATFGRLLGAYPDFKRK